MHHWHPREAAVFIASHNVTASGKGAEMVCPEGGATGKVIEGFFLWGVCSVVLTITDLLDDVLA